jgi:hypothetical protein
MGWLKDLSALIAPRCRTHRAVAKRRPTTYRPRFESLEDRLVPSANVLSFHNDLGSTGLNPNETALSPANVAVGSFGKIATGAVDGQIYAQPLVYNAVNISAGAHPGVRDVVFVATEHDSLYAIDADDPGLTGTVLWRRSFLDATNPNNNTLGATAISTVAGIADVNSGDINPEIGITGTPVIDAASNTLYLVAKTKETIGAVTHYVQRLHAINVADGTDRVAAFLIGDTTGAYVNNTPIYVYGTGDGSTTDPYNGTGEPVVQFNAQREHQRGALALVNHTVYIDWASHSDNGPYHGWVAAWDVSNLAGQGLKLSGVLNTSPNDGESGIWQSSGGLAFEANGSAFYFMTGNGTGGAPILDANGFPINANYNEAVVKVVADPTTSATHQNANGWGFKVADYFIPGNVAQLDMTDNDFGSGAPILLPDAAGIAGHPHLMVVGGKDGRLFVLDRDNLGKIDPNTDHVVSDSATIKGLLSTPAWFNGHLYVVSGYGGAAYEFSVNADGTLSATSQSALTNFGTLTGSPSISANGISSGIVWIPDRNANILRAYDASSLATELWDSSQKAGGADSVGALSKFAVPTVADGEVFVGTLNGLVIYGLTPPANAVPDVPSSVQATALSASSVQLTWQDTTAAPNTATGYAIEESSDGVNFTTITTAPATSRLIDIGGLQSATTYYFRLHSFNGLGNSAESAVALVTTTTQAASLDFSSGFANSAGALIYNGSAQINGSRAELTNLGNFEAGSFFSSGAVDVSRFSTQLTFQLTNAQADGFAFVLQTNGPTALGGNGGALGYAGIGNSLAIDFVLAGGLGGTNDSTGLVVVGNGPPIATTDLTGSGIDLHSGDVFQVNMSYDGTTLAVTIRDTVSGATASQSYTVNIPGVLGNTNAYVGFTGGTGGGTAVQDIVSWLFSPNALQAPATPSALGATPASSTTITLTWTNNAFNQGGYHLDRATDPNFTQNLITENLPATPAAFTDSAPGLAPGGTYYYRLRAFNSAGDSGNSNIVAVSIPVAPPKPTNAQVTFVSATEIDVSWTDNAGQAAQGYKVLRAVDHGSFVVYAVLPYNNAPPPSTYTWIDTGVSAGNFYEYHILAYNVSGNNDFTGTNATTPPPAPSGVTSATSDSSVTLAWTAPNGAVSYNIYRSTSAGGEGSTPLATGITTTNFSDTTVSNGTTYYYIVTAIDAGGEGARSSEVSALPSGNLARNKPATASSVENAGLGASNAVDGNLGTRWSSGFSDNQWLQVDLQATYVINRIVLNWENAYGKAYQIQVSADAVTWTTIYSTTNGVGGIENLTGLNGMGRYVRMLGIQRATGYGYSLWEFQVYGVPTAGPQPPTLASPAQVVASTATTDTLAVLGADVGGEVSLTYSWSVTALPAGATAPTFSVNGTNAAKNTVVTFSQPGIYGLLVTIRDAAGLTVTSAITINEYGPNLALGKTATSSADEAGWLAASNAVDGNTTTRWSSAFSDNQWLQVDLGASYAISRVVLNWENAFGKAYDIQVSADGLTWATIYSTATGQGGIENLSGLSGTGRFVRMQGVQRATQYGYSLWEFEVYGALAPSVASPATVVSETGTTANLAVLGLDAGGEPSLTYTWSVAAAPVGAAAPIFSANGSNAAKNTAVTFASGGNYTLLVTIQDAAGLIVTSSVTVTVDGPDLALVKTATSSADEAGWLAASNAVDGNLGTRWSSGFSDNQWLQVDLGASYTINRVQLNWENAFGKAYNIEVSADGITWTTIYSTTTGQGGVENLTGLSGTGRYIRMQGVQRATQYGYSLWEFAVYGSPS